MNRDKQRSEFFRRKWEQANALEDMFFALSRHEMYPNFLRFQALLAKSTDYISLSYGSRHLVDFAHRHHLPTRNLRSVLEEGYANTLLHLSKGHTTDYSLLYDFARALELPIDPLLEALDSGMRQDMFDMFGSRQQKSNPFFAPYFLDDNYVPSCKVSKHVRRALLPRT